jgi:hypothetical protein
MTERLLLEALSYRLGVTSIFDHDLNPLRSATPPTAETLNAALNRPD